MKATEVRATVALGLTIALILVAGGKLLHAIGDSQESIQANTIAIQAMTLKIVTLEIAAAVDDAEDAALEKHTAEQYQQLTEVIGVVATDVKALLQQRKPL